MLITFGISMATANCKILHAGREVDVTLPNSSMSAAPTKGRDHILRRKNCRIENLRNRCLR